MARSNNNNKLKAFVRFDGSGRIVPSSLIVQAFKPKVGNYQEIDAKECCNYVAPTTTTTTTATPTTTTTTTVAPTTTTTTTGLPISWSFDYSSVSSTAVCNGEGAFVTVYSSTTPLINGMILYSNSGLTIPVSDGWYLNPGPGLNFYQVSGGAGVISSQSSCGA
jgi:hypothetical protein